MSSLLQRLHTSESQHKIIQFPNLWLTFILLGTVDQNENANLKKSVPFSKIENFSRSEVILDLSSFYEEKKGSHVCLIYMYFP